jgi:chromosome segregation ATPase
MNLAVTFDVTPRLGALIDALIRQGSDGGRIERIEAKLDTTLGILQTLVQQGETMALDLANLETELTETKDAVSAIITYTQTIVTELRALAAELASQPAIQARLNAMADELNNEQTRIGEAIVAGTGAEEPGGEEPVP